MERLEPLQTLESDYYLGEAVRDVGPDSDEEMSSDDELQQELKKIAGISNECQKKGKRQRRQSDFESDMEDELDRSMCEYATECLNDYVQKNPQIELPKVEEEIPDLEPANDEDMECEESKASTSLPTSPLKSCLKRKSPQKKKSPKPEEDNDLSSDNSEEDNPIKKMVKQRKKVMDEEPPEFYDTDEDDDNERWVQKKNSERRGATTSAAPSSQTRKKPSAKIDNGSDAVLSCPGCMILLSRDCQRHEIYKDQYRAMFVENCEIDKTEDLKVEKTGKEKKRQKQQMKKMGLAMESSAGTPHDIFHAVKCCKCGTKVAVYDHDEVFHFFNVLAGYS
ncbi:unnamed protein product [Auanema sp. JU1783]|nr:unnamed protein product [Auanema sp. JU1783]